MNSEMVAKVAKALHDATPFKATEGAFERQPPAYQMVCRVLARAAIEAMREPTEAMIAAGDIAANDMTSDDWSPSDIPQRTFSAMITAALTPPR